MREINLDAKDKKLGRFASEVAVILMGKDEPDYTANKVTKVKVNIKNASLMNITEKKLSSKIYDSYSGFPGGRKEVVMKKLIEKKGYEAVLRNAVNGMLPKNKLRSQMMKNLIITE